MARSPFYGQQLLVPWAPSLRADFGPALGFVAEFWHNKFAQSRLGIPSLVFAVLVIGFPVGHRVGPSHVSDGMGSAVSAFFFQSPRF